MLRVCGNVFLLWHLVKKLKYFEFTDDGIIREATLNTGETLQTQRIKGDITSKRTHLYGNILRIRKENVYEKP